MLPRYIFHRGDCVHGSIRGEDNHHVRILLPTLVVRFLIAEALGFLLEFLAAFGFQRVFFRVQHLDSFVPKLFARRCVCSRGLSSSRRFCSRAVSPTWRSNSCSCLGSMNLSRANSFFARSSALFVAEETPELRDPADFELECFDPARMFRR